MFDAAVSKQCDRRAPSPERKQSGRDNLEDGEIQDDVAPTPTPTSNNDQIDQQELVEKDPWSYGCCEPPRSR